MLQTASVAGPAIGGLVLATLGVGWVYAINAVSFLFVIGARLAMDPPRSDETAPADRGNFTVSAALEGLRFVFRAPLIRSTMLLDFFATFFSSATALLPIFGQDILHVGARGYGWLYAAPAAGALVTSAIMVRIVDWIERRGEVLIGAVAVYGLATIAFGLGGRGGGESHSRVVRRVRSAFLGCGRGPHPRPPMGPHPHGCQRSLRSRRCSATSGC
jgi:hypothetical protein